MTTRMQDAVELLALSLWMAAPTAELRSPEVEETTSNAVDILAMRIAARIEDEDDIAAALAASEDGETTPAQEFFEGIDDE